jgi:hypothetical protein
LKILQIVIKNTSTMDFTVPVLKKLAQTRPNDEIIILYCTINRKNILRDSSFWDRIFQKYKINQMDYGDFLNPAWRPFRRAVKNFFRGSKADKIHFHEAWKIYNSTSANVSILGFLVSLVRQNTMSVLITNLYQSAISYLEHRMTPSMVNLASILPTINPQIILFDNRYLANFPGRNEIYDWMYKHKVKVGLLPHAPHLRDPVSEFCPFDGEVEALPDFCEFWVPLKFGTPWIQIPERQSQFYVSGYPGLDSDWLNWCKDGAGISRISRKFGEPLRCLFIMRRYLPQGSIRPKDTDPYILDFDDLYVPLKKMLDVFKSLKIDIRLIIKPHPANNYKILANDLERLEVKSWEISHESIYDLLPRIELAIGVFSTVLLVPAMAGIPSVLLKTKLQDVVNSEWPLIEEMYRGSCFYAENLEEIQPIIKEALESVEQSGSGGERFLRNYFDDNAALRVINRLKL